MADPDLERERRAIELFEAALDLPSDERAAYLAARAGADATLHARIASMLAADRRAMLRTGAAGGEIAEVPAPERIGAYRIEEAIGHGGMGSVYRAVRDTGDFDHKVAIKVIKPGLLSQSLVERFRGERRMLAGLIHPNIARLYDGGEIAAGSPFFIMEYVEGLPLMRWLEQAQPPLTERTRLFLEVCDAVAFAHRRLIVHRDLTPSNVLVTSEGSAKLIDFGIARLAEEPDAAREQPSLASLSLTPGYAAPERLTGAAVSTSADIYSLGKILARLTGEAAANPDIAAIIARATAADPAGRYPTVDALAADIVAWRDGFAVAAHPPERLYKARKFLRRHGLATGASALALTLLVGTLVYALIADSRAQAARREAEQRFEDVRSLAGYMLFDLNARIGRVPGNTAARAALAERAEDYLAALAAAPNASHRLRLETAYGLIRLAEIQGVPIGPNLGDHASASANLGRADVLLAGLPAAMAGVAPARARSATYRSLVALHGDAEKARPLRLLDEAELVLEAVPAGGRDKAWFEAQSDLRLAQLDVADTGGERARIAAILAQVELDRRASPRGRAAGFEARLDDAIHRYFRALHVAEFGNGGDAGSGGDFKQALALHLAAEQAFDSLLVERPDDPRVLYRAAWNLADGFVAGSLSGADTIATRLIDEADTTVTRLARIDPQDDAVRALQANIAEGRAQNLRDLGRFDAAIAKQAEVLAIREREAGTAPDGAQLSSIGFSQTIHGIIARDAGRRGLACDSWSDALANLRRARESGHIFGSHEAFIPGLEQHLAACANGASIDFPMR